MARGKISVITDDLQSDSGAVLWSFIKGEQLEYDVTVSFLFDATASAGYEMEAVVVEADNQEGQTERPTQVLTGGAETTLNVRRPDYVGAWDPAGAYDLENVVSHGGKHWRLLSGSSRVSALEPDSDPFWAETSLNVVWIQFPKTLGSDWAVAPSVTTSVYGFFELRVTEPNNSVFQRTWKPVRGMVEVQFSPTDIV